LTSGSLISLALSPILCIIATDGDGGEVRVSIVWLSVS